MQPRDDGSRAPGARARERGGVNAAAAIAEGVRDVPPAEIPRRLCAVAVELLPVTGASVSLRSNGMPVQVSASDDAAARMGDMQATLGEGPCLSAARTGAPVLVSDLASGRYASRWPVFAQQAAEAGVQAVYAIPLGDDSVCVGTLDLYGARPRELSDRELHTAQLVAAVMTVALMALPRQEDGEGTGEDSWLSGLTTEHDEIYQAIGMIMAQLRIGTDDALARLRARAFAEGRTALDVAHEVVAHRRRFDRD